MTTGMLLIRDDRDYKELVTAFARTTADYKILSIHFSIEGKPTLEDGQKSRFEYAIQYGGVKVDAVEVIPLTNTHNRTAPMPADKAAARIGSLNQLSAMQLQNYAMRLQLDPFTGRGIFCDSQMTSIRAKTMCAGQFSTK